MYKLSVLSIDLQCTPHRTAILFSRCKIYRCLRSTNCQLAVPSCAISTFASRAFCVYLPQSCYF